MPNIGPIQDAIHEVAFRAGWRKTPFTRLVTAVSQRMGADQSPADVERALSAAGFSVSAGAGGVMQVIGLRLWGHER